MKKLPKILLASVALTAVSACSSELSESEQAVLDERMAKEAAKPTNLTALMQANPDLSTAALAVGQSGIAQELKDDGPFTSFIAPNEAFKRMEDGRLEELMTPEKKSELAGIAKYGLVNGTLKSADIAKAITDGGGTASLTTLEGSDIKATMEGDKIVLEDGAGNKVNILEADIESSNGTMHIVDTVMMPN